MPLRHLIARLAEHALRPQDCRAAVAPALRSGDVMMLGDAFAGRLFGGPAALGGGLALVIDAGAQVVRLSPALAPDPLSCRVGDLQRALPGWVLRSRLEAGRCPRGGWGELAAAA